MIVEGIAGLEAIAGRETGVGEWFIVTQDRIDRFAAVTEDRQWIHVEPDRALRESPFGGPVAHGFLTVSLLPTLIHQAVEVRGDFKLSVNYGFNRLRFTSPVPAGSRIRARVTPRSVKQVKGGHEIHWDVSVEIEGREKLALVAEWITRLYDA
ncbi:MAG: MaoC family dehydratase [Bryobacteraceae bacterium]